MEAMDQVAARLLALGVDEGAFHLGGPREDATCVEPVGENSWRVFFFERGMRSDTREFDSLAAAATDLEGRLTA
jgi:hypothetical protein